ncbi:hypothetical protein JOY44_29055 [Phormidium sp. CLA17]|uniref:hypothetical protein n=1 Tax=Leptolyngbya sp. Cla-17 TaxID=2803751 RepID=UPI001492CACF|nr:hypothetical protein [Leptolyngbya sp. Cla-17]MBM0745473.1 hypothetical protein [Leptolyngbya sp. Cla-17]
MEMIKSVRLANVEVEALDELSAEELNMVAGGCPPQPPQPPQVDDRDFIDLKGSVFDFLNPGFRIGRASVSFKKK